MASLPVLPIICETVVAACGDLCKSAFTSLCFLAAGSMFLLVCSAEAAAPSGVYSGVYECRQRSIPLRLALSELLTDGTLGAVISYELPGVGRGPREPAFQAAGRFTASTGEFELQPVRWTVRLAGPGPGMFSFKGVYDATADVIRGRSTDPACGPVELKRDSERTAQLQAHLGSGQEEAQARLDQIRSAPPEAARSGRLPEACLALLRWVSRAKEEYGDALKTETLGELHPKLINLYEDAYFVPFFGRPIDQMTREDLVVIKTTMDQCGNSPRFRADFQGGLVSLFRPVFNPGAIPPPVARRAGRGQMAERAERRNDEAVERRHVREQFHETVDRLKALPGTAESYPTVVALEKSSRPVFAALWPSEFKAFETTLSDARRRSAEPLLDSRVSAALAAATTRDGILYLDQVAAENRELFLAVSQEAANREYERLATALHRGLASLMAAEQKRIDGFGTGLAAIEAGVRWHQEFETLYLRVANDEAVESALAHFKERRQRDLRAASALLAAEIRKSATSAQLQATTVRYVLETDRAIPESAPVFSALVERRWKLARDQELAKYSDFERQHMVPNTLTIEYQGVVPAPTEREIGLSVLRALAHNGGTILGPDSASFSGAIIEVKRVAAEGCAKSDAAYECRYKVFVHFAMSEGMRNLAGKSIWADLLTQRYESLNSAEPHAVSDRFVLSSTGWFSPTLEHKIQQNTLSVFQGLADDAKAVHCAKRPYDFGCR